MTRYTMARNNNETTSDGINEVFTVTGLTRNFVEAIKLAISETVLAFSEFGDNGNVITIADAARLRRIWDRVESVPKKHDDSDLRHSIMEILTEIDGIHAACLTRKNAGYKMPEEMLSLAAGYIQPVFKFIREELLKEN